MSKYTMFLFFNNNYNIKGLINTAVLAFFLQYCHYKKSLYVIEIKTFLFWVLTELRYPAWVLINQGIRVI